MNLPHDLKVSVSKLSSCFRNTSATYKYYWLLAIIESVEAGKDEIPKRELFARMIANAWFTVNYFHVSFGMQDKLQQGRINYNNDILPPPLVEVPQENLYKK